MRTHDWDDVKAELGLDTPGYRAGYEQFRRRVDLGLRVRELRLAAGLSQSALARLVGTHQPNIARLEAGAGMPKLETLDRIAEALGAELVVAFVPRPAA